MSTPAPRTPLTPNIARLDAWLRNEFWLRPDEIRALSIAAQKEKQFLRDLGASPASTRRCE